MCSHLWWMGIGASRSKYSQSWWFSFPPRRLTREATPSKPSDYHHCLEALFWQAIIFVMLQNQNYPAEIQSASSKFRLLIFKSVCKLWALFLLIALVVGIHSDLHQFWWVKRTHICVYDRALLHKLHGEFLGDSVSL